MLISMDYLWVIRSQRFPPRTLKSTQMIGFIFISFLERGGRPHENASTVNHVPMWPKETCNKVPFWSRGVGVRLN